MINLFYKPYLYYNLYIRHKIQNKRSSYSQFQEDLFIDNFFRNKSRGFYIDIGCYHPVKYSNTALLFNSLSAGLLRQATYTTMRLGIYSSLMDMFARLLI